MAKTLLFYDRPVPLSRETHHGARFRSTPGNFSFARTTNSVPLAGVEFAAAARDYPVVFSGSDASNTIPVALVGLSQDENYFVDAKGVWQGAYVPAFVRRYPFVLAEKGDGQFTVCVDEAYPGFNADDGEPLFDADGKERPFLKSTLDFLSEYQGRMQQTQAFVKRLHEWGLLKPQVIRVAPKGKPVFVLQGMLVVDEPQLLKLDKARLETLFRSGELGWIYAHLISLGNLQRLSNRFDQRQVVSTVAVPDEAEAPTDAGRTGRKRGRPN